MRLTRQKRTEMISKEIQRQQKINDKLRIEKERKKEDRISSQYNNHDLIII